MLYLPYCKGPERANPCGAGSNDWRFWRCQGTQRGAMAANRLLKRAGGICANLKCALKENSRRDVPMTVTGSISVTGPTLANLSTTTWSVNSYSAISTAVVSFSCPGQCRRVPV